VKLVYIAPAYPPRIGGVEYVVKSVAERLAKAHEVTVLAGEPNMEKPREEEINGVRIVRWPTWSPSGAYHLPRRKRELQKLLAELARSADVVHAHSAHTVLTVISALYAKKAAPNTKLVVTLHYHGTGHTVVRKLLWIPWRRVVTEFVEAADKVHAVSFKEADIVQSHYPSVAGKLVVIPHGVEEDVVERRWKGQESDYMIYAGRIERYKRLELAVELAKKMGLKLLIIGEGPHKEKLRRYAERYGNAQLMPPQPRHKYLDLLAQARYAVNPSSHEAFSIFTAEALAMGVPTIASATIKETLEALGEEIGNGLWLLKEAKISTWDETATQYVDKLYRD
jgi:glycosyltransferase involved in cell wall biosynthesis